MRFKFLCFLIGIGMILPSAMYSQNKLPNIVYILADDLGYGDISYLNENSKIHTPHIDALGELGISFSDAHTNSAVCTPTRYGVLTGRYAWRTSMKNGVLWSYDVPLIDDNRLTLASLLKQKNYHTATIGKWHLGLDWVGGKETPVVAKGITKGPTEIGFDEFYGISASLDIPPYVYIDGHAITTSKVDTINANQGKGFWRKGPVGADFKHIDVLQHLTDKSVDYIHKNAKKNTPFFLYFPLPAPHTPILPTEPFKDRSGIGEYGDFTIMVDDVVGQITKALKEAGIEDNTMIVFTSDNGVSPMAGLPDQEKLGHFSSYIYRGHKADIYEGGHRVPFLVKWPNQIAAGQISDETICLTDFMATLSELIDIPLPNGAGEDSFSILPALKGEKVQHPLREATVHHSINGTFAIRKGEWKLIFGPGSGGWSSPKPNEARKQKLPLFQLYNLKSDPGEQNNLYSKHPDLVNELTELMELYVVSGRSTPGTAVKNDTPTKFLPKPYEH